MGVPLDGSVHVADLVFVDGDLDTDDLAPLGEFLAEPLLQSGSWTTPAGAGVEITLHPGATDGAAAAVVRAATHLGVPVDAAATGRRLELPPGTDQATIDLLLRRLVVNPVIENWTTGVATPELHPGTPAPATFGSRAPPVPGHDKRPSLQRGPLVFRTNPNTPLPNGPPEVPLNVHPTHTSRPAARIPGRPDLDLLI
jgi:phosphoribosylformylglycinamidine (FGAM) synthase PurS component